MQQNSLRRRKAFTLIELLVDDPEVEVETETYWVTRTVWLRVPIEHDDDMVDAVVEAICAC